MKRITIEGFDYFIDEKTNGIYLDCCGYEKVDLEDFSDSELIELYKHLK